MSDIKKSDEKVSTEIAVLEKMNLVTQDEIEFDGPSGFDGVDSDCVTIPFLKIAQSGTDEAKKGSAKYIKGLEPGMFFCPATRRIYGEEVSLVILRFYRQYVVYESRDVDAHFKGTMAPEQFRQAIEPFATRERSYHLDSEGHRYVDTRNFIVLVAGHYFDGPMLLSMASTGIAPSRKWLTQAQNVRASDGRLAPIWASVWNLSLGFVDNDQGSYYQVSRVNRLGYVTQEAKQLVVSAFLDAQGMETVDLEKANMAAQVAQQEKMAEGASQAPAKEERVQKQGPKAATAPSEDEIF